LVVTAELDERIPDDAIGARRRRRKVLRAQSEPERLTEPVLRERERAERSRCDQVVRPETECVYENALRLHVVGRVTGLPRALLVREAEEPEPTHVVRLRAERVLQLDDVAGRIRRKGVGG